MNEKYLIINAGSSSLKFSLYLMPEQIELINGLVEKIGKEDSCYTLKFNNQKIEKDRIINNHTEAVKVMLEELIAYNLINSVEDIKGIGHRVLHGGEFYSDSVIIDDDVLTNIKSLTKLGPLHHPGEIAGIESMKEVLPTVPQVAVFDTAFHQTMPIENYMYAVPYDWYEENGVRKYGFHGTSHKYITEKMQSILNNDEPNLIICHIGSGASISCVQNGKCIDTTMGLTPLDGLIMGTRSGTIDSSIIEYISKERNLSIEQITSILNKNSGLIGITGKNDFRDLESLANNGDKKAQLAMQMMKKSIIKYIAQYYFELDGNLDAIVFTAGIGENAISLRENLVKSLSNIMGIELDQEANNNISKYKSNQSGFISKPESKTKVIVLPTNEEYMILKDTYNLSKQLKEKNYQKVLKR
jgi:acetate kinase